MRLWKIAVVWVLIEIALLFAFVGLYLWRDERFELAYVATFGLTQAALIVAGWSMMERDSDVARVSIGYAGSV